MIHCQEMMATKIFTEYNFKMFIYNSNLRIRKQSNQD